MKNILLSVFICLPVLAFSQKPHYKVSGNISGSRDGMKVYMKSEGVTSTPVDDSTVIKNEHFTFTGTVEYPVLVKLTIDRTPEGEKSGPSTWLASNFYLENSDITYAGDVNKLPAYYYKRNAEYQQPVIKGSATQDDNVKFNSGINAIKKEMGRIDNEYIKVYHIPAMEGKFNTEEGMKLANEYSDLNEQSIKYTFDYIHAHPESRISFDQGMYAMAGYTTTLTVPQIDDLVSTIGTAWKGASIMTEFLEEAKKAKKTALGIKYQDFEFLTPEGKKVMLSQVVPEGKIVLVEFWASWCGPCRAEIPHLKHLNETKSNDFSIVSISLDEDDASWRKAMKEEGMIWTQLVDYKGFEGEIAQAYNIFGIPHSLLLDREGRIIKVGLRGAFLDAELQKLGVK